MSTKTENEIKIMPKEDLQLKSEIAAMHTELPKGKIEILEEEFVDRLEIPEEIRKLAKRNNIALRWGNMNTKSKQYKRNFSRGWRVVNRVLPPFTQLKSHYFDLTTGAIRNGDLILLAMDQTRLNSIQKAKQDMSLKAFKNRQKEDKEAGLKHYTPDKMRGFRTGIPSSFLEG